MFDKRGKTDDMRYFSSYIIRKFSGIWKGTHWNWQFISDEYALVYSKKHSISQCSPRIKHLLGKKKKKTLRARIWESDTPSIMGRFMPSLIFIKKIPVINYHVKSTSPDFFAPELSWSFFMFPEK